MNKPELKNIPLDLLHRGKFQAREQFDETYIAELAVSIKENGVIQPIVVRPKDDGGYEIIAGECRWRASQRAGLDDVPCLVRPYSDDQAIAATAIENIQRRNLNPIEEAEAYRTFIDELGYLHEEIAAVVGKSRTKITNSLRLLKLDERVRTMLIQEEISEGHGKILAGVAINNQFALAKKCKSLSWSVRKLEQEIRALQNVKAMRHGHDPDIATLERLISEHVGSATKIETNAESRGGWLRIKYFNNETLAGLLDKLGVKYEE